jgi:SAM-dependent methyltransferase
VRRHHFERFAPICPRCARTGAHAPLFIATIRRATPDGANIMDAILHCPRAECRHEYPVLGGIPVIVPELRRVLSEHGIALLLRDDLDPALESLVGDALGPESWFDTQRQTLSTYGWDSYAAFDPAEAGGAIAPGSAARCLERLLAIAGTETSSVAQTIDLGCGGGGATFALARSRPEALVLGVDTNLGLLRLAQAAAAGRVAYPRRIIGLVYDRREFAFPFEGSERVDFWACDALALPFRPATVDLATALNLLDAVGDPLGLLRSAAGLLRPRARLLLGTPFDWAARATPIESWIGGHSQRTDDAGAAVPRLHGLLGGDIPLRHLAEDTNWPWELRLHERASVHYRSYLLALEKMVA